MEIKVKPFNPEILEQKLKEAYPAYFIKRLGKRMTVRKKKITLTQQVSLVLNPEQGTVKSQTNIITAYAFLGMAFAFSVLISIFMGISFALIAAYVLLKSKSIKAMEGDVMDKAKKILNA